MDGFYLGPALHHYWCYRVLNKHTNAISVTDAIRFCHHGLALSLEDKLMHSTPFRPPSLAPRQLPPIHKSRPSMPSAPSYTISCNQPPHNNQGCTVQHNHSTARPGNLHFQGWTPLMVTPLHPTMQTHPLRPNLHNQLHTTPDPDAVSLLPQLSWTLNPAAT